MKKIVKYFLAFMVISLPAHAELPLTRIETYLNTMTTFEASFEQIIPGRDYARGIFYMNRPRQFLWQYDNDQKLVSTGKRLYYVDQKTEQATQLPLNKGLASILTRPNIELSGADLYVQSYQQGKGWFTVEVAMKNPSGDLEEGSLALTFKNKPIQLAKITTKDAFGGETHVSFKNIKEGQEINPTLFEFINPFDEF